MSAQLVFSGLVLTKGKSGVGNYNGQVKGANASELFSAPCSCKGLVNNTLFFSLKPNLVEFYFTSSG